MVKIIIEAFYVRTLYLFRFLVLKRVEYSSTFIPGTKLISSDLKLGQRNTNKNILVNTEKGLFYIVKYVESIQGVTPSSKPVYVLNIHSGVVTKFLSIRLCMEWFEKNNIKISYNHVGLLRNKLRRERRFIQEFVLVLSSPPPQAPPGPPSLIL